MRYKIGENPAENAYASSAHFVELTIFLTFLVGIGFLAAGIYGKQGWMKFWGLLTIVVCIVFWAGRWLEWFNF